MKNLKQNLNSIESSYQLVIANSKTPAEIEAVRLQYLGRQGSLATILKSLGSLPVDQRKQIGISANQLKNLIEKALTLKTASLKEQADNTFSFTDLSMPIPYTFSHSGRPHPTQQVLRDIYDIFLRLGFAVVDGPEVETDWYNFEVLNMPPNHPARDMQDTFYVSTSDQTTDLVPRTHTSAAQIRYMENNEPPFKIIVPGKVYRNEDEDRTHSWSFYQVEGLVIGEKVSMSDLKGTLLQVMQGLLGDDVKIRFRPSYFPYTEPSVEIDVWYRNEWLEVCGAGMVHPLVLERGGIDSTKYGGFAFGFGPDRLTVIRYNLSDIRQLWRPNLLLSEQL
ncbi:phenylalanine--tRNA ligase subunit alpha [Candidatus Saccharibacteria bacterium]|nr:phenylalanine--tRNA ligase subunit alpha [Candidatus Saccharibacteria bacterium]